MLEANLMMVFAVLDDFDQYLRVDHWQWNRRVKASILDHVLHGDGAESDLLLNLEDLLLFRLQLHRCSLWKRHVYMLECEAMVWREEGGAMRKQLTVTFSSVGVAPAQH